MQQHELTTHGNAARAGNACASDHDDALAFGHREGKIRQHAAGGRI
jgi:hypothetical protein